MAAGVRSFALSYAVGCSTAGLAHRRAWKLPQMSLGCFSCLVVPSEEDSVEFSPT